jgi:hypothetical protein
MPDESLMGGAYHGSSNSPGLTRREYYEMQAERDDRYDYDGDGPDRNDAEDDDGA